MDDEFTDLIAEIQGYKSLTGYLGRGKLVELFTKIILRQKQFDKRLAALEKRIALLSVGQVDLIKLFVDSTPTALLGASLREIILQKGSTNEKQRY